MKVLNLTLPLAVAPSACLSYPPESANSIISSSQTYYMTGVPGHCWHSCIMKSTTVASIRRTLSCRFR